MKICNECYELYDGLDDPEMSWCPIHGCGGEVFEADDFMIDTLIALWKKGWKTRYCCAGHIARNNFQCYIMFEDEPPEVLPGVFSVQEGNAQVIEMEIYEQEWQGYSYIQKVELMKSTNIVLNHWAHHLVKEIEA